MRLLLQRMHPSRPWATRQPRQCKQPPPPPPLLLPLLRLHPPVRHSCLLSRIVLTWSTSICTHRVYRSVTPRQVQYLSVYRSDRDILNYSVHDLNRLRLTPCWTLHFVSPLRMLSCASPG